MGDIKKVDAIQDQIYKIAKYLRLASNCPVNEVDGNIFNAQNELAKLNAIWQEHLNSLNK